MNIIRKLKISEIVDVEWSIKEKKIIDLFDYWFKDLVIFIDPKKPQEINFMKSDGNFVLQEDNENERLWVRYDDFWDVLESKYFFNYHSIKSIMKSMIERTFKKSICLDIRECVGGYKAVEKIFKLKIYKIEVPYESGVKDVENSFKLHNIHNK